MGELHGMRILSIKTVIFFKARSRRIVCMICRAYHTFEYIFAHGSVIVCWNTDEIFLEKKVKKFNSN